MKKRNLIFLIGFKNTGKDTVAKILNDFSYGKYHIVGFADALKREYYLSAGINYQRDAEDRNVKEFHRDGIIAYGEKAKQDYGKYHWIERALDTHLFEKEEDFEGVIVPDCRRVEEVHWYQDFFENKLPKYQMIRDDWNPHFLAVHREDAEIEDNDYLTHNAIRVATDNYVINRLVKNYKSVDSLKKQLEEIYAIRFK